MTLKTRRRTHIFVFNSADQLVFEIHLVRISHRGPVFMTEEFFCFHQANGALVIRLCQDGHFQLPRNSLFSSHHFIDDLQYEVLTEVLRWWGRIGINVGLLQRRVQFFVFCKCGQFLHQLYNFAYGGGNIILSGTRALAHALSKYREPDFSLLTLSL